MVAPVLPRSRALLCGLGVLCGVALLCGPLVPATAFAGERTDVVDAFDADDPFDFHLEPAFRQHVERGVIVREAPGVIERSGCPEGSTDPSCNEAATVFERELDYRRVTSMIDIEMQFGLHRNLEFHAALPIVVSDRRRLEYASGVNADNSSFFPSLDRVAADLDPTRDDPFGDAFGTYRYFDVPDDGVKRSGVGDLRVGLSWAPFDHTRQSHASTLMLRLDYLAPTGTPARGENRAVGRGVHELQFELAASRAFRNYVEPYFALVFALPVPAARGLFSEPNDNSINRAPGARFDSSAGTEIIMFTDARTGQHYTIALGVDVGYTLQGRDYSPLFDALAGSSCNGQTAGAAGFEDGTDGNAYRPPADLDPEEAACAWVVQQPGNVENDGLANRGRWSYAHDGITDVEGHGRVGGHFGLHLQFSEYVGFHIETKVLWNAPHFLTFSDAGRDANGNGTVDLDPDTEGDDPLERNPNYNLTYDAVGRRVRIENNVDILWGARFAFQF